MAKPSYTVLRVFAHEGTHYTRANESAVADLPASVIREHLAAGSIQGPPPEPARRSPASAGRTRSKPRVRAAVAASAHPAVPTTSKKEE